MIHVKVLFLFTYNTSLKNWSDSGYLTRELRFFEKIYNQYKVKFIFLTFGDASDFDVDLDSRYIEVLPIYKYIDKKKNNFYNFLNLIFNVHKLIKKHNLEFNLIKTNQLYGSWIAMILKILLKKPLIIRTGYDLFLFSIKDKKNFIKIFLYYVLTFFSLNISNIYTVTSNSDFNFISKLYLFDKKKLRLRKNWVESYSKEVNFSDRLNNYSLLSVGRLESQKDYEYLIRNFNDTGYQIDIVGTGSLENNLKEISSPNINFVGNLSYKDLIKFYEKYLFYISSTNYEGNPKSILEAMSRGCIVVAPDLKNTREIITNGQNGFLYDKKNENIKDVLDDIFVEKEKLNLISNNALICVKKNNSLTQFIDNEYNDYVEILSK